MKDNKNTEPMSRMDFRIIPVYDGKTTAVKTYRVMKGNSIWYEGSYTDCENTIWMRDNY